MAKKKDESFQTIIPQGKVFQTPLEEVMPQSMLPYAEFVILDRALPRVEDGLKPVQRRILYTMAEMGLTPDKPHKKSARIVGDCMGKYHPHGDSSVYDAMVRMAQDFNMRMTLVNGHGNFGSVDGDPPAAMRYTEARLAKIASEMLRDIDKETVDWTNNFDDSLQEPTVLPSRIPNLLVNGSDGIAVGMATAIPPHNLGEVIDAIDALIDNPEITIDELMKFVPAPDYPTGGLIMGRSNIKRAYKTGRGGIVIRAKAEIEEYPVREGSDLMRQRIVVTELPYQVNKEKTIVQIADLVKEKRIDGISDIREESDRDGMRIVIEVKRDAQAQVVLNTLYKHTNLQTSQGITFLALADGEPKVLNLKEMLVYYLKHQEEVIVRRTRHDLAAAQERAHIVEGLVKAQANIDRVIKIIKQSRDNVEAGEKLMEEFYLSDKQANAILEMKLRRLTSLEIETLQNELVSLNEKIADFKNILASPKRVTDIVKTELQEIKEEYDNPRRSELVIDYDEIDIGDLIDKEDVVISMTHYGYIKRLPTTEYKAQHRGGKGVTAHRPKEEDFVEKMFVTNTHDTLLYFTNFGRVYAAKAYEIPEAERTARGRAIINLLQLGDGEKVSAVIPIKDDEYKGNLVMSTKRGMIKKTPLTEFKQIRKVGKVAIKLNDGDELISVQQTCGIDEILIASQSGKCIRFSEENVRPMGRDTQGVRAMKLAEDDNVVDMAIVRPECDVLTVSENGFGKRVDVEEFRLQSRAGKGIKAGTFNSKTGRLVNMKLVDPEEDVMVISDNGTIIRMLVKEISKLGRDTQGVRMMRVKNQGTVVCVATAPHQEVIEDDGGASGDSEE